MAGIPTLDQLESYNVNRAGQIEGIRQSLYDFQTYAATGQTSLTFFQVPVGQGGKTIADTNMEAAGSLPAPKRFLVESIELYFYSGALVDTFTVAAAALPQQADDTYAVAKSGSLNLFIGSKNYLEEATLGRFPPSTGIRVDAANASNSATVGEVKTQYATMAGRVYTMEPPILLVPTQNFKVTLTWPAVVALPSGIAGRIGVVMNGILYRNSQ